MWLPLHTTHASEVLIYADKLNATMGRLGEGDAGLIPDRLISDLDSKRKYMRYKNCNKLTGGCAFGHDGVAFLIVGDV
ncbi:hypothetical protein NUV89_25990 [Pseudomonas sp. 18.1.10]|uniref:hypothetical protein n=1 Tax=Pseudomonas sp. 18.1.10 TaxID=2969302 RepID=UPI0021504E8B|nr:hypothetical protein [Pseudomonas sp. 18.1.10]MCR4541857.1 hypothetical protein [Pseudomonas sp. 18.1.10]